MINTLTKLTPEFKNSIINNFDKNIDYNIKKLYDKKYNNYQKKNFINLLISRIYGYEGNIILNYNLFTILKFINKLTRYSKTIKQEDKDMYNFIDKNIKQLMIYINDIINYIY